MDFLQVGRTAVFPFYRPVGRNHTTRKPLVQRNSKTCIVSSELPGQLLSNLGHTVSNFLRLTPKRCSHMGCALKWNPAEHSWDCPCHGSRFTADGSVLDGPAQSRVNLS